MENHDLTQVVSADGSIVMDKDWVYVITDDFHGHGEVMQIDYFHGEAKNEGPVAQMMQDELDILASEMISIRHSGRTVRAIITIQRQWRKRRRQTKKSRREDSSDDCVEPRPKSKKRDFLKMWLNSPSFGKVVAECQGEPKIARGSSSNA